MAKKTSPEDKKIIQKMFDAEHKRVMKEKKAEIKRLGQKINENKDGSQN